MIHIHKRDGAGRVLKIAEISDGVLSGDGKTLVGNILKLKNVHVTDEDAIHKLLKNGQRVFSVRGTNMTKIIIRAKSNGHQEVVKARPVGGNMTVFQMKQAKRKTIKNDTEENDDWMKSLPGYKDEVRIHEEIAKRLAAKNGNDAE